MSRTNLTAKTSTEKRLLEYLETNASAVLVEKINSGKKTFNGALNFARKEAHKIAEGLPYFLVEDETVFGWIVHFFEETDIVEPKKQAPAMRVPGGATIAAKPVTKPLSPALSLLDDILM